jgi:hypothetical protein
MKETNKIIELPKSKMPTFKQLRYYFLGAEALLYLGLFGVTGKMLLSIGIWCLFNSFLCIVMIALTFILDVKDS